MSQPSSSSRGVRRTAESKSKKVETMRKKVLTKAMQEVSLSDTSDSDTQPSKTSQSSRTSIGEPSQQSMATLPATANRLFLETKEEIEQCADIKDSVKEKVIENFTAIYEIILRLSESRQTLQIQLEKARANTTTQVLAKEREYAGRLVELAEGVKTMDVRPSVSEILTEVKSLRQLIVFDVLDQLSNNQQHQQPQTAEITKQLQESSIKLAKIVEESKRCVTYAEMAARPVDRQNHSIIVSSKIDKDTSEDVLHKIRGAANARISGVKVERIRKAKNQKVVVSCSSKSSLNDLKEKLKSDDNLKIDDATNKDPLIIIKNVLMYNTDEDIQASLKTQNKEALKDILDADYRAIVKYRRKARNSHECHAILQVSPKVWQALTSIPSTSPCRCHVFDQSPLVQCTRLWTREGKYVSR